MMNNRFSNRLNEYFNDNIRLSFITRYNYRDVILVITKEDKVYQFQKDLFRNAVLITSDKRAVVDSLVEESLVEELCGKGVTDISSGDRHIIARTGDGKVYCWGLLGMDDGRVYKPALNEYLSDKKVTHVCCSHEYSLALTIDGQVYAWGYNEYGQIGNGKHGSSEREPTPYHVRGFDGEKVKAIACGFVHSMALTETGKVFGWGSNVRGQLGIGRECSHCNSPKRIEMNGVTVEKICCGRWHSLLLSRDGVIYVFGRNDYGQLGTGVDNEVSDDSSGSYKDSDSNHYQRQFTPKKLVHSSKFTDFASKWGYSISAALSESGSWYIWGHWGKEAISEPKATPFESLDDIFEFYLQVNYRPVEGRITPFDDTFKWNERYGREFDELEKLGEGSFGTVFKVSGKHEWDKSHSYAVKKVNFNANTCDFLRELESCAMIQELNDVKLVKYYDMWIEDLITDGPELKNCTLYIRMELCDTNLKEVVMELKRDLYLKAQDYLTPLGYFFASEVFIEILEGVQYLHQYNPPIIHKNLKPYNILLKIEPNRRSFVKIGELGLAEFYNSAQHSHRADRGAIKYRAPEVFKWRKYDTKADIYSLGIIAQELFNFDLNNDSDDISPILLLKYKAISDFSLKMTAQRIRERPNCEEILKAENLWALNAKEFNVRKELEKLDRNSYILKIIKHVIGSELESVISIQTFLRKRKYEQFYQLEEIDSGRFGSVFKMEKEGVIYAVKKIEFMNEIEREFLKELKTCTTIQELDDERLVKYHDVWVEDSTTNEYRLKDCILYIQMELCDTNLRKVISEMKAHPVFSVIKIVSDLPVQDYLTSLGYFVASEVFIGILKGVRYLHQHKPQIIHRDLKPLNILLKIEPNRRSFVKIGDFGLAALHECAEQSHTENRGTTSYVAPEVLRGRKYDTRADIYSLGFIAQELFSIDVNRDDFNDIPPVLQPKYQTMSDKSVSMTAQRVRDRPKDCEEILKAKDSWGLNASEFDIREELEDLKKSTKNQNSYVLKITKHVLELNIESELDLDSDVSPD